MASADIESVLARIRSKLSLDSETEHDMLEEIRSHLEEAAAKARRRGLSERDALAEATARFGVEETGAKLQEAHAGWGTADAVIAAALPTICGLVLRWLIFAPEGATLDWPMLLSHPALWLVAGSALAIPFLKFRRWPYALATWAFFWIITIGSLIAPTIRW